MLQAVILAAGRSTRTYPLTATRPKPLLPVVDRPLLRYQLEQLAGWVDEVLLVVGYRKELILQRFGDRFESPSLPPLPLVYVDQPTQRGTADALREAAPRIRDRCLVLNGDDLYHRSDLQALARLPAAILVCTVPDPQNRGVVTVRGDRILQIVEKPDRAPQDALASVGAYVFSREDLTPLGDVQPSARGELELPDLVERLARGGRMGFHRVQRIWFPLTYAWDLLKVAFFLLDSDARAREMGIAIQSAEGLRNRADLALAPNAILEGPLVLGPGVRMDPGSRLRGPAVLGEASVIEAGAVVERSVLFPSVHVEADARVSDSVLGEGSRIRAGAVIPAVRGGTDEIRIEVKGVQVATGLNRLGLIAGDGATVMPRATVPSGTILSPASTFPCPHPD